MKNKKYRKLKYYVNGLMKSYVFNTVFSIFTSVIIAGNISIIDYDKLFSSETLINELIGRNTTTKRYIWKTTKKLFM